MIVPINTCDTCNFIAICKLMSNDYTALRNTDQCMAYTDNDHKIVILSELMKHINVVIKSPIYRDEIFKIEAQMKELCKSLGIDIKFEETDDIENRFFTMNPLTEEADQLLLKLHKTVNSEEFSNNITKTVNEIEDILIKNGFIFTKFSFSFNLTDKDLIVEYEKASDMISITESYEGDPNGQS